MDLKQDNALPDLGTDVRVDKIDFATMGELCLHIRREVFVEEQNVSPEEEMDDMDHACEHYVLWSDGHAAGTARVYYAKDVAKIQRVALMKEYRGKGFGRAMMLDIIYDIQQMVRIGHHAISVIELSAQVRVLEFYESLGFVAEGDIYDEAGIPHRKMFRGI